MVVYPENLPTPLLSSYSAKKGNYTKFLSSEEDVIVSKVKKQKNNDIVDFQILTDIKQYNDFLTFYEDTLKMGADFFKIRLKIDENIEEYVVKFVENLNISLKENKAMISSKIMVFYKNMI